MRRMINPHRLIRSPAVRTTRWLKPSTVQRTRSGTIPPSAPISGTIDTEDATRDRASRYSSVKTHVGPWRRSIAFDTGIVMPFSLVQNWRRIYEHFQSDHQWARGSVNRIAPRKRHLDRCGRFALTEGWTSKKQTHLTFERNADPP